MKIELLPNYFLNKNGTFNIDDAIIFTFKKAKVTPIASASILVTTASTIIVLKLTLSSNSRFSLESTSILIPIDTRIINAKKELILLRILFTEKPNK